MGCFPKIFTWQSQKQSPDQQDAQSAQHDDNDERTPLLSHENQHQNQHSSENLTPLQKTLHTPLHAYILFCAVSNGYLPSTSQLIQILSQVESSHVLHSPSDSSSRLSPDGREFLTLLRRWIRAFAELVRAKNPGDEIQDVIWGMRRAKARVIVQGGYRVEEGMRMAEAEGRGGAAYDALRTLMTLLWSSREFQGLVQDLTVIARQTFADAARVGAGLAEEKAGEVEPSAEEIGRVGKGGEGARDQSATGNGIDSPTSISTKTVVHDDSRTGGIEARVNQAKQEAAESLGEIGIAISETVKGTGKEAVASVQRNVVHGGQGRALKTRLGALVRSLKAQPTGSEVVETLTLILKTCVKRYIPGSFLPPVTAGAAVTIEANREMEEVVGKLATVVGTFGSEEEWRKLARLVGEVVEYVHQRQKVEGEGVVTVDGVLERVVGGLTGVVMNPEVLLEEEEDGGGGSIFLKLLRNILRDAVLPPAVARGEAGSDKQVIRIQKTLDNLLNQLHTVLLSVLHDQHVHNLLDITTQLLHLLFPSPASGETEPATTTTTLGINENILTDCMHTILPTLLTLLQSIPIPRLEITSPEVDLLVENLILTPGGHSQTFLPSKIEIETKTELNLTQRSPGEMRMKRMKIKIKNATPVEAEGVGYVMRVHSWPVCWLKESGVMSFWVPGGFDLNVDLDITSYPGKRDPEAGKDGVKSGPGGMGEIETAICTVRDVKMHLHGFDYRISPPSHMVAVLAWLVKPFIRPLLARTVERNVEELVDVWIKVMNREMVLARERIRGVRVAGGGIGALVKAVWGGWGRWRGEEGSGRENGGDGEVNVSVGVNAKRGGVFDGVYAPGSIVGLWKDEVESMRSEGRRAWGERYTSEGGWRSKVFEF